MIRRLWPALRQPAPTALVLAVGLVSTAAAVAVSRPPPPRAHTVGRTPAVTQTRHATA